jgi:hypothetical protein
VASGQIICSGKQTEVVPDHELNKAPIFSASLTITEIPATLEKKLSVFSPFLPFYHLIIRVKHMFFRTAIHKIIQQGVAIISKIK